MNVFFLYAIQNIKATCFQSVNAQIMPLVFFLRIKRERVGFVCNINTIRWVVILCVICSIKIDSQYLVNREKVLLDFFSIMEKLVIKL